MGFALRVIVPLLFGLVFTAVGAGVLYRVEWPIWTSQPVRDWEAMFFESVGGILFAGVGVILLSQSRGWAKALATERRLKRRFPNEPWRWRKEWAEGSIESVDRATARHAIAIAFVVNLFTLPAATAVATGISEGDLVIVAILLMFAAVGLWLAVWAARSSLILRRFKGTTLVLEQLPIEPGTMLRGTVRVAAGVPVDAELKVRLSCVRKRVRRTRILWQSEVSAPKHRCLLTSSQSSIPIDIPVPKDRPLTSASCARDVRTLWYLDVSGACPGPDFWTRFEVPVFYRGSEPGMANAAHGAAFMPSPGPPDRRPLEGLGIVHEPLASGGEAWTFRRARHKRHATALTLLAALWTVFTIALLLNDDFSFIGLLVCGAVNVLLIQWMLSLWFTEHRIALDDRSLTLTRRRFGRGKVVVIPRHEIRAVRAAGGTQVTDTRLYYDLQVESAGGRHTAACMLDPAVAAWFAEHLMKGSETAAARDSNRGLEPARIR